MKDLEDSIANFINEGDERSRTQNEVFDEFVNEQTLKGKVFVAIGNLLSDKPRRITQSKDSETGEYSYTATNVMPQIDGGFRGEGERPWSNH